MTTRVLMVTDMSGSMADLADDVRGGFNAYLDGLAADTEQEYRITAIVFDTEYIPLCVDAELSAAPRLDKSNYMPRGATALLDAVGRAINTHPDLKGDDRAILVIQTDGYENSSHEFSYAAIKERIERLEATGKWAVIYIGAGPDTWAQAAAMGVAAANYVNTPATPQGTADTYRAVTLGTQSYSRGGTGASVAGTIREQTQQ
jgi:hypothetical protein